MEFQLNTGAEFELESDNVGADDAELLPQVPDTRSSLHGEALRDKQQALIP